MEKVAQSLYELFERQSSCVAVNGGIESSKISLQIFSFVSQR